MMIWYKGTEEGRWEEGFENIWGADREASTKWKLKREHSDLRKDAQLLSSPLALPLFSDKHADGRVETDLE